MLASLYARARHPAWHPARVSLVLSRGKHNKPSTRIKKKTKVNEFDEYAHLMHGRKNSERRDSITIDILKERAQWQERIQDVEVSKQMMTELQKLGFGSKKRMSHMYKEAPYEQQKTNSKTSSGAGGFAHFLLASDGRQGWPLFRHILPEIAFAGHSNCGKSTLVNAMAGIHPRKGPAGVSERAGWTDNICFYNLGKKPPVLTLVVRNRLTW
jgi:GTP-binding protein